MEMHEIFARLHRLIGYELAPVVVTQPNSTPPRPAIRQAPVAHGQLENASPAYPERRWWEPNFSVAEGGGSARGRRCKHPTSPNDVQVLIYAGVCREQFEPATACKVAAGLGVGGAAFVYDVSNASWAS